MLTLAVTLRNNGALDTHDLRVTLLEQGGVISPGGPQDYGVLAAGGASVSRSFQFTVSPEITCGAQIYLTFHLDDNGVDLGNITATMQTGTPKIALQQNFDRSHLAQLPPRWTRAAERRSAKLDSFGSAIAVRNEIRIFARPDPGRPE